MVQYGGLVQTDMGLNQNQRPCGPLMVWEITKNGFDDVDRVFQMVVVCLLGCEEDHGGSIVFDFMYETGGNEIWTPFSVASYWM